MIAGLYLGLLLIGILLLVLTVWRLNRLLSRDITRRKQEEQLSLLQTITMEVAAAEDLRPPLRSCCVTCAKRLAGTRASWLPRRGENVLELGTGLDGCLGELESFNSPRRKPVSSRAKANQVASGNRSIQPG